MRINTSFSVRSRATVTISILFSVLVGAPAHALISAADAELVRSAKIYVIVEQAQLSAAISGARGGDAYGIVGSLVNLVDDVVSYKSAQAKLAPLHNLTGGLDFRKNLLTKLQNSLSPQQFPKLKDVELIDRELAHGERDKIVAAQDNPVLFLRVRHFLAAGYRTYGVATEATLWSKGAVDPKFRQTAVYQSLPASADLSLDAAQAVLSAWVANDGAKYRAAQTDGISETVKMLGFALAEQAVTAEEMTLPADSFLERKTPLNVMSIEKTKLRVLVESKELGYMSVPTATPNFASVKDLLEPVDAQKGRVYFYRFGTVNAPFQPLVMVDSKAVGSMVAGTFFYADLDEGNHMLELDYAGEGTGLVASTHRRTAKGTPGLSFTIRKGEISYMAIRFEMGLFSGGVVMAPVQPNKAEPELAQMTVGDSVKYHTPAPK